MSENVSSQFAARPLHLANCARLVEVEVMNYVSGPEKIPTELAKVAFERHDVKIHNAADLRDVDRILEALVAAELDGTDGFSALKEKAREYLKCHPELLCQPWCYLAGTIHDMHRELAGGNPKTLLGFARFVENKMENHDPALHKPPSELSQLALEPQGVEICSTEDLLGVDCLLECLLAAGLGDTAGFSSLKEKAKVYLTSNPVLLTQPWVHGGGTVFEMHCELAGSDFFGAPERSSALLH